MPAKLREVTGLLEGLAQHTTDWTGASAAFIVALLVYCGLGLLTDALVRLLERRALRWRQSFVAQ